MSKTGDAMAKEIRRLRAENAALRARIEAVEEAAIVARDTGDWTALTRALAAGEGSP